MPEAKTMRTLLAALAILVITSLVAGVLARHRHHHGSGVDAGHSPPRRGNPRVRKDPLEDAFVAHMRRLNEFRCHEPVPKSLAVLSPQTGLSWRPAVHEQFNPEYTVLHRCGDTSGCCQNHLHSCQAAELEEVGLVFKVVDTLTGRWRYVEATATNHTRCRCEEKSSQPK